FFLFSDFIEAFFHQKLCFYPPKAMLLEPKTYAFATQKNSF
ncbi:hypothetical protein HMPREF9151_00035, partial [Hoylesella saccharolytica F0055]